MKKTGQKKGVSKLFNLQILNSIESYFSLTWAQKTKIWSGSTYLLIRELRIYQIFNSHIKTLKKNQKTSSYIMNTFTIKINQ